LVFVLIGMIDLDFTGMQRVRSSTELQKIIDDLMGWW
jgi:hypothetical protein